MESPPSTSSLHIYIIIQCHIIKYNNNIIYTQIIIIIHIDIAINGLFLMNDNVIVQFTIIIAI